MKITRLTLALLCMLKVAHGAMAAETPSVPETTALPSMETWDIHGQATNLTQWHPSFKAPYSGQNSFESSSRNAETTDLTLYLGVRLWQGGELYVNPEYDQGFGLSNTLGLAGYSSGEAYKVGENTPYLRLPRVFLRQTVNLGGEEEKLDSSANQLAGSRNIDNLILTLGKFSVVDIFDTNAYAHDPRGDFFNWSVVDSGAFDYAADSWGFSYGAAAEWTRSWWTLRGGFFALPKVPNATKLDKDFRQYEWVGEVEGRHQFLGHPGKVKFLAFVNHANMGDYGDAVRLALATNTRPDMALVRRSASRPGYAANLEQELAGDLGFFARASMNGGSKEAFAFTEINRSLAMGFSLRGDRWSRHDDTVGMAMVVNGLSPEARRYFAAGGMGILIGDGALNYGPEKIAELFYSWRAEKHLTIAADYQHVVNPAYNRDRGPVPILGLRAHVEF